MYGSGVGQISNTGAGSGTDISIHRRLSAAEEEQKTLAIVSVAALKEEHTDLAKRWQKKTQARHHEADLLALPLRFPLGAQQIQLRQRVLMLVLRSIFTACCTVTILTYHMSTLEVVWRKV